MFGRTCVRGILDTDFYKLTMGQAYLHQIPDAEADWEFKCRTDEDLTSYLPMLREEMEALSDLYLTDDQYFYLKNHHPFLSDDYLCWLRQFRFDPSKISYSVEHNKLSVKATGPQMEVSMLEIPLLATLAEIRNRTRYPQVDQEVIGKSTYKKMKQFEVDADRVDLKDFRFVDFGTRRRFSYDAQKQVIDIMHKQLPDFFMGTSNPFLAREYELPCVGTMAHEWFQAHQQLSYPLVESQKAALLNWKKEFPRVLGIALTDIIGVDSFCRDLDSKLAHIYKGYRQDSGDPFSWGDKIIQRLEQLGIDPTRRSLIFSDGLNFESAIRIYHYFHGRIKTSFGIGTWLMGDFGLNKPMNIVMKMVQINGKPVAKISDSPGKCMCQDEAFLEQLMSTFQVADNVRHAVRANF